MTEHTSIRVTVDAKGRAEESKRDDETWNEYLQRCTDNPPEVQEFVESTATSQTVDLEATTINEIARSVEERLR